MSSHDRWLPIARITGALLLIPVIVNGDLEITRCQENRGYSTHALARPCGVSRSSGGTLHRAGSPMHIRHESGLSRRSTSFFARCENCGRAGPMPRSLSGTRKGSLEPSSNNGRLHTGRRASTVVFACCLRSNGKAHRSFSWAGWSGSLRRSIPYVGETTRRNTS